MGELRFSSFRPTPLGWVVIVTVTAFLAGFALGFFYS